MKLVQWLDTFLKCIAVNYTKIELAPTLSSSFLSNMNVKRWLAELKRCRKRTNDKTTQLTLHLEIAAETIEKYLQNHIGRPKSESVWFLHINRMCAKYLTRTCVCCALHGCCVCL